MWYDKIVNILKNNPNDFNSYVNINIAEGYDEYTKEQIIEIFIETLNSIERFVSKEEYKNIIEDMFNWYDYDNSPMPWYGHIKNIAFYDSSMFSLYLNKYISNYQLIEIITLLNSLIESVNANCSCDIIYKIYNEIAENITWLYRKKEYLNIYVLATCGKYSLISFDDGLLGYAVVSDFDNDTKTWTDEVRFDSIPESNGGMCKIIALQKASTYLYDLISE